MFTVRPAESSDLPAILAMSGRTGTGLTSLPSDEQRLKDRIERSLRSFNGGVQRADECYVFVLAGTGNGAIAGICAIEVAVGLREAWYNYRVGTLVHASRELDVYNATPTLFLSNFWTPSTGAANWARCCPNRGCCSSPNFPTPSGRRSSRNCAAASTPRAARRFGKDSAGISSPSIFRARIT